MADALIGRTAPDQHGDAGGGYPVISQYYDNEGLELFWERERGIPSRRKLRIRVYGGERTAAPPAIFAEIKHKYQGRIAKRRVQLDLEQALELCVGHEIPQHLIGWERMVAEEIQRMSRRRRLLPAVVLRYERQAFRGDARWPDLRVTFDEDLRCRARDFRPAPDDGDFDHLMLPPHLAVLEIKVDRTVPVWLARVVAEAGCVRQRHSKYALAMAVTQPNLRGLAFSDGFPAGSSASPRPGRSPSANGTGPLGGQHGPASSHLTSDSHRMEGTEWTI